jgi:hypothetical protein
MSVPEEIADDEQLLRHVPGGSLWQAPGPRITGPDRLLHWWVGIAKKALVSASARLGDVRLLGLKVFRSRLTMIRAMPRFNPTRPHWTITLAESGWLGNFVSWMPRRRQRRKADFSSTQEIACIPL